MSDYKITFAPGFYPLARWVKVGDATWSYNEWALPSTQADPTAHAIYPPMPEHTMCPACNRAELNEAQDRCARDGRLTCYKCGWKGPA